MPNIVENFNYFDGYVKEKFLVEMKDKKDYLPMFFNMMTSNRSVENFVGLGNTDYMSEWTGSVDYDTIKQNYKIDVQGVKKSKGLSLEREIIEYKNYNEIVSRVQALANTVYRTRQKDGAAVFNNAFSTSGLTDGDGNPLCYASHKIGEGDAVTQSNTGTSSLTVKNIDIVQQAMINFKDDKGNPLHRIGDCIIVGPKQYMNGKKIVGSEKEPFSANNDINVYGNGELKLLYFPWITENVWFLADSMVMKESLKWIDWRVPKLERYDEFDTEALKYKVVGMWNQVFTDYTFIYGNQVS